MLEVPSLDDLITLFQSCSCDLRQTLSTLQFLAQSSTAITSPKCSPKNDSIIPESKWQSSRQFDTMYYSQLGEQWNESILKIFFDDLTRKYTSEYEQTHLSLANHSKNDTKR
jgi:hypothetical protein